MNMRMISFLLIVSFTAIAVFGFVGMMNHGSDMGGGCLAEAANRAICPAPEGSFGAIEYYLGTFRGFSMVTLVSVFSALLLFSLAFLSLAYANRQKFLLAKLFLLPRHTSIAHEAPLLARLPSYILSSLARHERAPSSF